MTTDTHKFSRCIFLALMAIAISSFAVLAQGQNEGDLCEGDL